MNYRIVISLTRKPIPPDSPPEAREFRRMLDSTNWSHEETAARIGVTRVTVSQYARGQLSPSKPVLLLMAYLTKNPLSLPGLTEAGGVMRDEESGLEPWECEALARLRRMPEKQRSAVLALMHEIAPPIKYPEGGNPTSKQKTTSPAQPGLGLSKPTQGSPTEAVLRSVRESVEGRMRGGR